MKTKASVAAFFLLLLLLTGCMGIASNPQPTVLQIARPGLVGPHQQQVASLDRTVRDATAVQRFYTAAQALPHPSQYPLPCPNDLGLVYHLTFLAGTSQLQQIDVQPLGCHWVYLSQTDVRQADQSFLNLLAKTIGLPSLIPAGLLPGNLFSSSVFIAHGTGLPETRPHSPLNALAINPFAFIATSRLSKGTS
jgi:hypothetical protein